jgi:hypothetical protein
MFSINVDSIPINQGLLAIFFLVSLLIFTGVSVALVYHWRTYEFDHPKINKMMRIYFIGSAVFFAIMLIGVFAYPS